jgi:lysozyme
MAIKKSIKSNSKKSFFVSKSFWILAFFIVIAFSVYKYRNALLYYFSFKTHKTILIDKSYLERNKEVLLANNDKIVGIDVSHYQGRINWEKVQFVNEKYPVDFVFIRATQGNDKNDSQFAYNWNQSKKHHFIRGAYHYYRPNENSLEQAENFIQTVSLVKGDLPPVLDIEKLPKCQSIDSLKVGLRRFLNRIEDYYNVKPIVYSGERYYQDFLKEEFSDYPFWIANYNFIDAQINDNFLFWQFTEQAKIKGISEKVDLNIFNGNKDDLKDLTIE